MRDVLTRALCPSSLYTPINCGISFALLPCSLHVIQSLGQTTMAAVPHHTKMSLQRSSGLKQGLNVLSVTKAGCGAVCHSVSITVSLFPTLKPPQQPSATSPTNQAPPNSLLANSCKQVSSQSKYYASWRTHFAHRMFPLKGNAPLKG